MRAQHRPAEAGAAQRAAEPLLALVEAYREQACASLLDQARDQARAMLAQARADARQRVHQAVQEERARARSERAAAQARWQTVRRHQLQAAQAALLVDAWEALVAALRRRWQDAAARRAWIAKLLREAQQALPQGPWEVRHPPDLPEDELAPLRAALAEAPHCVADPRLTAGLRIRSGEVVLDGSLEGLAPERARLQGELMRALVATAQYAE